MAPKVKITRPLGEQIGIFAAALSLIEFKTAEFAAA